MAFDQSTRNRLARFVSETRFLLSEEFTRQLQNEYGMDPESGAVTELEKLTALDDSRRETARILRETLEYYLAGKADDKKNRQETLQRIVREQAFTVLNRLCALRMAESRGILIESIAQGYQSKGFLLYARLAGAGLGETGDAYRTYLFSLFDEFAVDLAALFDRFNPQGRLFPRETALLKVTALINDPEIDPLWAEDETIGWIYQYFNSKEERKAMRDASQAPRNSRELAVRNQFFTPRYVVEFLTDNTLGRIWYEMTKGATALKDACQYLVRRPNEIFLNEGAEAPAQASDEALSQEELLRQPAYIPHRPLKDPREIKMLDPACGSMHFGLYAFDLFEQIYAEAWDLEESLGEDALWRLADLDSLHKTYPDRAAFLRDVPRLIIERNIHGVDIDPRAVQIAGLSLWLRAQKSWQAQGVRPQERQQIRRSNIVCAEPMPGDRAMLEEFLGTLKEDRLEALMRQAMHIPTVQKVRATKAMATALGKLVRVIWQEMELAGEAGSLLKIEETLREAIAEARKESEEKSPLFQAIEFGADAGEEKLGFWDQAETLTLTALQNYAEQAAEGQSYRRRLFAGDAMHGFAFIDLCQKRYDAILMNPPFGKPTGHTLPYLKDKYPDDWKDIYAAFIRRMLSLNNDYGSVGAITSLLYLYSKQLRELRKNIVSGKSLFALIELGSGVLDDAAVETALSVYTKRKNDLSVYLDLFNSPEKESLLLDACNSFDFQIKDLNIFKMIYGWPLCLHMERYLLRLWQYSDRLEPDLGEVVAGNHTFDDFRFLRLRFEVPSIYLNKKWFTYEKGGEYQPFVSPAPLVFNWENNGAEPRNYQIMEYQTDAQTIQSISKWFKPGLTYPRVNLAFSPKILPSGCIFSEKGMSIFPTAPENTYFMLGLLSSSWSNKLLNAFGRHRAYENRAVSNLPYGNTIFDAVGKKIEETTLKIVNLMISLEQRIETSPYFVSPITTADDQVLLRKYQEQICVYCDEIDDLVRKCFNEETSAIVFQDNEKTSHLLEKNVFNKSSYLDYELEILSWSIGCIFGRWDIRYAINMIKHPELPNPIDPLPNNAPGALVMKLDEVTKDTFSVQISKSGILADDVGSSEDIEKRMYEVLAIFWNSDADLFETKICEKTKTKTLREYIRKPTGFFSDHLKKYSASRRQAPIYWQLSTPSNSYSLWLYYHRLNDQTLFTCVNDFVDPKIKQVSEEAKSLRVKKSRSSSEEKELERLTDFERELKDFRDELLRVAKFWKPNLNDGVQITAAPLWKLFQHKPWQKKLKETWESLEVGEYDWAHLAYSIWSDRVREKCKTDKSLAIAHDLEHVYVEPQVPLKKKAGRKKKIETDEMFDEDN
ncbi:BREX-1 system adenine-specific DNA-methyltransferase PglX [Chloroflexota bacterium]